MAVLRLLASSLNAFDDVIDRLDIKGLSDTIHFLVLILPLGTVIFSTSRLLNVTKVFLFRISNNTTDFMIRHCIAVHSLLLATYIQHSLASFGKSLKCSVIFQIKGRIHELFLFPNLEKLQNQPKILDL